MYGTDGKDKLWGDDKDLVGASSGPPGMLGPEDTIGGDDLLKGYGDDDDVWGGYGDDILYGGDGKDWLYGEFGDDKIFGGEGDDTIWGDDKAGPGDQRAPVAPTSLATGERGI